MKAIHALCNILLALVLLCTGAGLGYAAFRGGDTWGYFLEGAESYRLLVAGAGWAVVLLTLIWMLSALPRKRGGRFLSFTNPDGEVQISLDAIREFLTPLQSEFPGVIKVHPEVRSHRGELLVTMGCDIRAGNAIPQLSQQLQERVRDRIVNGVGLSSIRSIRVVVRQITEGKRFASSARKEPKRPLETPVPSSSAPGERSGQSEESNDTP